MLRQLRIFVEVWEGKQANETQQVAQAVAVVEGSESTLRAMAWDLGLNGLVERVLMDADTRKDRETWRSHAAEG